MNLNVFKTLFGSTNFDIEEKVSKNGYNYIVIKKTVKGEYYKKKSQEINNFRYTRNSIQGVRGSIFTHGMLIWFNKTGCTVKPISCRTFKSAKGFSSKEYYEKANKYYDSQFYYKLAPTKQSEHIQYLMTHLADAPWYCKFNIPKPIIYFRKCKNGSKQIIANTNFTNGLNIKSPARYFTDNYNNGVFHKTMFLNTLKSITDNEDQAKLLAKMLYDKINKYVDNLEVTK